MSKPVPGAPLPSDDADPLDPLDEELVAYLDGELPEEQARQIEQRLAADPQLRRRAILLKKTYELLDYLPRPEASPDFATRTLEKIPASPRSTASLLPPAPAGTANGPPSTSMPIVLTSSVRPALASLVTHRSIRSLLIFAACLLVGGSGGYLLLTSLALPGRSLSSPASSVEPATVEHRLIAMLPLYIGVDDLSFLLRLAEPEYFGDDPLVETAPGRSSPGPPGEADAWPAAVWEQLIHSYRHLPPARQAALQELDRDLFAQEPVERDYLLAILEAYAFWLSNLPEDQRRSILAASDAAQRLQRIRELREQQWLETLPGEQQKQLRALSTPERIEAVRRLKRQEADRREAWSLVRRHAEEIAANRIPWPFHDEGLRRAVLDFAARAFQLHETGKIRLTANESSRYHTLLTQAEQHGGWNWFHYGREVYNLSRKYERYLLPEPIGKPITDFADLGATARLFDKGRVASFVNPHRGKWPEFALAIQDYVNTIPPHERPKLPPLGPTRPSELRDPLRQVVERELLPKLRPHEQKILQMHEGKWPDYCRELRKWAWFYDVSLPGMMLPGSPRQWDNWYGPRPALPPLVPRFFPFLPAPPRH
ncbi:MAG: hypothetical protein NZU63_05985 [Gemmataceae bacterium]|nr:hypothetical protein [Gemmataceae bacterium]MDW8242002.1 hypothetical protein [Thermogemmata sp.]